MSQKEKIVTYTSKNTYLTQNSITEKTKNVWLVLHGMGYLSRYFLKYFNTLDADENYIIVPQAPSKYYLKDEFKHVGASWLTKENTAIEIQNVMHYIDAVFEAENIPSHLNLVIFGFSQGVSIAARWMAYRKMKCKALVLYAGGIPNELKKEDFDFVDWDYTSITMIYGDADIYLTPERLKLEQTKTETLFGGRAETITFKGGHEVKPKIIQSLIHEE